MTFHRLTEETSQRIGQIIASGRIPSYTTKAVLDGIIADLRRMDKVRNAGEYVPSYTRAIVDSWPYGDQLGQKLLEIAELYRRMH